MRGGAIAYDTYPPLLSGNYFEGNQAPYGDDIASYPKSLKLWTGNAWADQLTIPLVASGQVYAGTLQFGIFDVEGKVIRTEDQATVVVKSNTGGFTPGGVTLKQFTNGRALIDGIIFSGDPGVVFNFTAVSSALPTSILESIFGIEDPYFTLTAEFRECVSGEIEQNNLCQVCPPERYALGVDQTICLDCMPEATCFGGKNISLDYGYWRPELDSDTIYECFEKEACNGGFAPEN